MRIPLFSKLLKDKYHTCEIMDTEWNPPTSTRSFGTSVLGKEKNMFTVRRPTLIFSPDP